VEASGSSRDRSLLPEVEQAILDLVHDVWVVNPVVREVGLFGLPKEVPEVVVISVSSVCQLRGAQSCRLVAVGHVGDGRVS
jgi:hypothetical protein